MEADSVAIDFSNNDGNTKETPSNRRGLRTPLMYSSELKRCVDNNGRMPSMNNVLSSKVQEMPLAIDIANMLGGVFPVLPPPRSRNYAKFISLSLYPLSILIYYSYCIVHVFTDGTPLWSLVFFRVIAFAAVGILIPASLSYTRRAYNQTLVYCKESAVATAGKNFILVTFVLSILYVVCLGVTHHIAQKKAEEIPSDVAWVYEHNWVLMFSVPNFISMVHLVTLRCKTLEAFHQDANDRLLDIAKNGEDANFLHAEIITCNAAVRKASNRYLQAPLGASFALGSVWFVLLLTVLWTATLNIDLIVFQSLWVLLSLCIIFVPLISLTKIDFRSFLLNEAMCRNTKMKRSDLNCLLTTYSVIKPRAYLFGFYLTRARVVTLMGAFISSILPKILQYLKII